MKKKIIAISLGVALIIAAALAINANLGSLVTSRQQHNDSIIAESMAYHVGVMAYLYGYPIVDMVEQMHNQTHRIAKDQHSYAPANRFYRFPEIVGPETGKGLRAPNNDTLYFSGWYDVSREPVIIHAPDTSGRYYTIAVTNLYAEVEHIGRRTTGTAQNYFALTGPRWNGTLPDSVQQISVESEKGWLLGRMLVDGPKDFNAAMELVNDIWMVEQSEFVAGQRPEAVIETEASEAEYLDSLAFFSILNQQLKRLPERPAEAALMSQFEAIGIGRSSQFNPDDLEGPIRRGLEKAIEDGQELVAAAAQRTIPDFNGWMISNKIGRYGFDYLHRAAVAKGGYGNLPEESLYPAMIFDADGELLNGDRQYELTFEADKMPPVDGFWSLAAYKLTDLQLEQNEIERYSIGDRTDGLHYSSDGSLKLSLQHRRPTNDKANWLPVPAGKFMLVMRLYEPAAEALNNEYLLPELRRLE